MNARIEMLDEPDVADAPRQAVAVRQESAVATSAPANDSQTLLSIISRAASDPTVDIVKMERLWAMHEGMKARAAEEAFNAAMNLAQSEMGRVAADAANQQTRSVYATYGKLDAKVRPVYTRNGFSLSFDTGDGAPEGTLRVLAYVSHKAGHTRTYRADIPNDGKGAKGGDVMTKTHASGSAMSYGMRYLLKLIFNIAIGEEDDDGNAAGVEGDESVDPVLVAFRAAAMQGQKVLRAHYEKHTPTDQFWRAHHLALKAAAKAADERGAQ